MPNQIIGKVLIIGQTENIQYRDKVFTKRELVLDCSHYDRYTGQQFENYVNLTFSGNKISELDTCQVGELVTVTFFLSGRKSEKEGSVKYFTNIIGIKIEPFVVNNGSQAQTAPAPISQPTPQAITQQSAQNAQVTQVQQPAPISGDVPDNNDDLPF